MQVVGTPDRDFTEVVDGVHLAQLAVGERMSVQQFHVEPDAAVPKHSHENEQVGYIASGTLTFDVGEDTYVVGPGESYWIPAEQAHAARNETAEPVKGVDVFSPPREAPNWDE